MPIPKRKKKKRRTKNNTEKKKSIKELNDYQDPPETARKETKDPNTSTFEMNWDDDTI